eukprot:scaffold2331_cov126-Cylindrotheca_fusiformis.AAC.17
MDRQRVRFGNVSVLEFHVQLGANPSMRSPLTLGWKVQKRAFYSVDSYEDMRSITQSRGQLRLTEEQRTLILLNSAQSMIPLDARGNLTRTINRKKKFDHLYGCLVNTRQQLSIKAYDPNR